MQNSLLLFIFFVGIQRQAFPLSISHYPKCLNHSFVIV